jgi:type III secretory pathway lipoprotein EscJ
MTTIHNYFNVAEAEFALSLLQASGIEASLLDETAASMGLMFGSGGMRLQVEEADVERALEILANHVPETDGTEPAQPPA